MKTVNDAYTAANELAQTVRQIDPAQVEKLAQLIQTKQRIFVSGAGRSLLMLKAFAMRLMHIGYTVYVVGAETTPAFLADDLLIVASGSGMTQSLLDQAQKASNYGGTVIALTIFADSKLAQLANDIVVIPAYTDKLPEGPGNRRGVLPGGSMFEEAVLLLGDTLIVGLAQRKAIDLDHAFENHANLE